MLIIDDEADFGLLLKRFFRNLDYTVYITTTLAEGLAMLETMEPDFIFLDNNLPDGMGWKIKEKILKMCPNTHLNLISSDHYMGKTHPSMDILEKPISVDDLNRLFG